MIALAIALLRRSRLRLALAAACLAVGVAARVALGGLGDRIDGALGREARTILGADIEVASYQPLPGERIAAALPAGSLVLDAAIFPTMAGSERGSRAVEVRAVPAPWPIAGTLALRGPGGAPASAAVLHDAEPRCAVAEELLRQTGLAIGDRLVLGRQGFAIAAVIAEEPGISASPFQIGPRVLIGHRHLAATGLAEAGSRIRHQALIALPDPAAAPAAAAAVQDALGIAAADRRIEMGAQPPATGIQVRTSRDASRAIAESIERFTDFLRLLALAAVILGAVGVGAVVRAILAENREAFAVIRTLGGSGGRILGLGLIQAAILGLAGAVLGGIAGSLGVNAISLGVERALGARLGFGIDWGPLGVGAIVAVAAALLAALPAALLAAREAPLASFRAAATGADESPQGTRWRTAAALALAVAALALFARAETRSWPIALGFVGAIAAAAGILAVSARLILPLAARLARRLPGSAAGLPWRLGLANLARPGLRPGAAVVALGIAGTVIGFLVAYRASWLAELDPARRGGLPAFFAIDLQEDQREAFLARTAALGIADVQLGARVPARLRMAEPANAVPGTREAETARFFRDREQNLSYAEALPADNRIVAGAWLDPRAADRVEASVEERWAQRLGVGLGDQLRFDVAGTEVTATITSLRHVDWLGFRLNFFVLLTPSALAGAPATWIASIGRLDAAAKDRLRDAVAREFPNITLIDVAEAGAKATALIERMGAAIRILALAALAAALAVVAGLGLATAAARRSDAALLRSLGAAPATLSLALIAEFAALGLFALCLGLAAGVGAAAALLAGVLGLPLHAPLGELAAIAVALALATAAAGWLACRSALRAPPLAVLREG